MTLIIKTKSGNLSYALDNITEEKLSTLIRTIPIEDISLMHNNGQIMTITEILQLEDVINVITTWIIDKHTTNYDNYKKGQY